MRLEEYISDVKMDINNFVKLNLKEALSFDFLTQGEEADRTELAKDVYRKIFPWFNDEKQSGDTLNTYRLAINKYYGSYYRNLSRKTQLEIISIIEKYTRHSSSHLFEFESVGNNSNKYFQICNNYQLGNFFILPVKNGMNPKRAKEPYFDFFDCFIQELGVVFNGVEPYDELTRAMKEQQHYFPQFENIEDFVGKNFNVLFLKQMLRAIWCQSNCLT
ncbi:hypothetical protein VL4N_13720 [Vagococcus lutrae]|uniref:hypothetical protein n=1 Tax=Vagococcus lutrae TaxID=81947 RepID=UPI00192536E7|nr:hypothetical protein [Vagococcus lutrae]GEQ62022.1 hypothetical protein VL2N_13580 [Vagococcus lutrae]GEQ63931.1 hypothetical protein VL3N_13730 [Vagococcus lutrae]GEQ65822.1 hypothetical protein VL4N_13720 [Vagococcus lutrae]